MNVELETMFEQAEGRYLKPDELKVLTGYVHSLPVRMEAYRSLRDREIEIVQHVADQLVSMMPRENVENVEQAITNLLVILRHCAMAMLLNDESFLRERLDGWLQEVNRAFDLQAINEALYRLLDQTLQREMPPAQLNLLRPYIALAQTTLVGLPLVRV